MHTELGRSQVEVQRCTLSSDVGEELGGGEGGGRGRGGGGGRRRGGGEASREQL